MKRRGNCYVTCEALFHLLGGTAAGWVPYTVRHEGDVHWFLVKFDSSRGLHSRPVATYPQVILDPTASQFKTPPPYNKARGRGFLTKTPSKRVSGVDGATALVGPHKVGPMQAPCQHERECQSRLPESIPQTYPKDR